MPDFRQVARGALQQVALVLREAEEGSSVGEVFNKAGISVQSH